MGFMELLVLSFALAMDACAVSVCKGMALGAVAPGHMLRCGAYFGFFQALMPLLGYGLGLGFQDMIERFDHWIAFILLAVIGLNMLREEDGGAGESASFAPGTMLPLAIATSIDAMAVGLSLALLKVSIIPAVCAVGMVTFGLCAAGVLLGNGFGSRWKRRAKRAGGVILILIGLKILLEHLFF